MKEGGMKLQQENQAVQEEGKCQVLLGLWPC